MATFREEISSQMQIIFFLGKQQICATAFIPVLFCKLVRKSLI